MQISSILLIFLFFKSTRSIQHLVTCPTSSDNVFNLCFYNGSKLVKTTYGGTYGYGYGVVLRIGTVEHNIKSTSALYNDVKIVTLLINVSEQVGIRHEIQNNGQIRKTISLAIHADTQIYNNDNVPIYRVNPMKGFRFADSGYEVYLLFLQSHEGHAAIDSLWYGKWNNRTSNLWVNATSDRYTTGDSGLAYSWQNYTLNPGEKLNFTTAFTTDPNFNFSIIPSYIPTEPFTPSKVFTPSRKFTKSKVFTSSKMFSESLAFSESNSFSPSSTPSQSPMASETPTASKSPTESDSPSPSVSKSPSASVSESPYATPTRSSSPSQSLTASQSASLSRSPSFFFSCSVEFSKSKEFSRSNYFSDSSCFSFSGFFTKSNAFTKSLFFTESDFINDKNSKDPFDSNFISLNSNHYDETETNSVDFSDDVNETNSVDFSDDVNETNTNDYSNFQKSTSEELSISLSETNSEDYSKSSKDSNINEESNSMSETNITNESDIDIGIGSGDEIDKEISKFSVIQSFDESDGIVLIPNLTPENKKKGSNTITIVGIVCGIVAVLAITAVVVVLLLKKKKAKANSAKEDTSRNSSFVETKSAKKSEASFDVDDDRDLDFWL